MEDDLFLAVMEDNATMEQLEAMMEEKRIKSAEANERAKRANEERERKEAERREAERQAILSETEKENRSGSDSDSNL